MTARRAIAYLRVSTQEQADSKLGLEAQERRVRAYATAMEDLQLVAVARDEGVSAKTLDRPGLQAAFKLLRAGKADTLIVAKLDRLTRSVRDLGTLLDGTFQPSSRYQLVVVQENIDTRTAAGRMVANLLGAIAQWERETTAERTKAALAEKRARGEYAGGNVNYGYQKFRSKLVPCEAEQAVIAIMLELRGAGMGYRAIAKKLNADCVQSRTGGIWYASGVQKIIEREQKRR